MIKILFMAALIALLLSFFTRKRHIRKKKSGRTGITPNTKQSFDPLEITRQILGDGAMKKIYTQPRRIVIAKLDSKMIAAIKASDSGPMIVINKEHEQSEKLFAYLVSKREDAKRLLDVICHTDNATSETCNLVMKRIAEELSTNQEELS
jgi:hypothetical protein